jgi:hypothetical protein
MTSFNKDFIGLIDFGELTRRDDGKEYMRELINRISSITDKFVDVQERINPKDEKYFISEYGCYSWGREYVIVYGYKDYINVKNMFMEIVKETEKGYKYPTDLIRDKAVIFTEGEEDARKYYYLKDTRKDIQY